MKWAISVFLLSVVGCLVLFTPADAGNPANAYDFETITVTSSTAIGFTAAKLAPAYSSPPTQAFITVETTNIRFRVDGSTPTQTVGHLVQTTSSGVTIKGEENLRHFYAVGIAAGSALQVTYER